GEHDGLPLEKVTAAIREKLSVEDQAKFREAVYARHNGSLVKLIRRNSKYNLVLSQERKPDSHTFHYIITRASSHEKEQGNTFFDEQKLLAEIVFQIKHSQSLIREIDRTVGITAIHGCLPEDARKAIKKSGGMLKFMACFPKVFEVFSEKYVRLL
ncbi:hypothetical protein XU18_2235, partial [Perkinsela sp. CCAP 1560/4]